MASFSFKKRTVSKARWHADFRMVETLPDIKVIRTKFLINVFFIILLCVLVALFGYQEFNKIGLRQSIESLRAEVESRSGSNRKITKQSNEFRALANKIDDIETFTSNPIRPAWLLVELSRVRTQDVVYDTISYSRFWDNSAKEEVYRVRLGGKGRTTADISELKNRLAILDVEEGWYVEVAEEGNPSKDVTSGIFSFVIALDIRKQKEKNGS